MEWKPVVLIVRDPTEWMSDDFLTLFAVEGYDTRDLTSESLPTALSLDRPFGAVGTPLPRYFANHSIREYNRRIH